MAEGKNKIVVYADWLGNFEDLTDEELGKLMRHFFEYVNDLNPILENRLLSIAWKPIQATLKRDLKKWESYVEKQKANGSKGGRPKTQKTQAFIEKPKKADSVSVSDSVNEIIDKSITYTKKEFFNDWNKTRTEVLNKPSHLNRLDFESINTLNGITKDFKNIKLEMCNALKGFFKQETFPNGQDYTTNAKHFLNHFSQYSQAYYDKNSNIYGKKE